MAEYIERDKALREIDRSLNLSEAYSKIAETPAANVVPVVRCRDCEHSRETNMFGQGTVLICGETDYVKQPDGYCNEGERKDGDG